MWPPPHGAVPPSEKDKPAQLLGVTVVGNVQRSGEPATCCRPPRPTMRFYNVKAQDKADFSRGYIIRGKATNP